LTSETHAYCDPAGTTIAGCCADFADDADAEAGAGSVIGFRTTAAPPASRGGVSGTGAGVAQPTSTAAIIDAVASFPLRRFMGTSLFHS
jgi:hypothetical protein